MTATAPLGTDQVHQELQGDPSMDLQCQEPTTPQWATATTTGGTGVRQRMLLPGGALETAEGRAAPGLNSRQI